MGSLAALSHKLELSEVMYRATQGLAVLKLKLSGVSAVSRTDGGWKVIVELVERVAVPDSMDLLGVYEVHLDETGELVGYERIRIRRRSDLEEIPV
jgi:Gas vesicle synthesis protein GvpO